MKFVRMIMLWSIIGAIAAICTTVGFIPQIIRGIKTKSLSDVSPIMMTFLLVGCSLWLVYGIHLKNPIIMIANGFTLSFVITILLLRALFEKKYKNLTFKKASNSLF
jgi:MtN3 and saliva related transmembrane protein